MKHSIICPKPNKTSAWWPVLFWLLVWQGVSMWVNEPILLVSPIRALQRLSELFFTASFWGSVLFTLWHILLGFLLSAVLGICLAIAAYRFPLIRRLISPLISTVRAIPVASFVILVLLWVPSRDLSILISLLIGLPVIYGNALHGLDNTDPKLLEMAQVFRIPFARQFKTIYLHELRPFLQSGLVTAMGLCWKSGVAAEVIGIPGGSIGEKLYKAKIYLETPDLFCWTLVVVLLSIVCEKGLKLALRRVR